MITLYDITSRLPNKAWSPNTFKIRISLNYKGIPFKTEWIEYPDIEPTVKRIGGTPTGKWSDGRDYYSLPVIYDSATDRVITDSEKIAEYLDETYPDKPTLFPPGMRAGISVLEHFIKQNYAMPIRMITLPACHEILSPPSQTYFRATRERMFERKLEEFAPLGPARDKVWKQIKEGLDKLNGFYDKNGASSKWFLGDVFSYSDAIVIGYLLWTKFVLGADSKEWKTVASWNDGRWEKLLKSAESLYYVN